MREDGVRLKLRSHEDTHLEIAAEYNSEEADGRYRELKVIEPTDRRAARPCEQIDERGSGLNSYSMYQPN